MPVGWEGAEAGEKLSVTRRGAGRVACAARGCHGRWPRGRVPGEEGPRPLGRLGPSRQMAFTRTDHGAGERPTA